MWSCAWVSWWLTKHDDIKVCQVVLTQPVEPCLKSEEGVLVAAKLADEVVTTPTLILDNKHIPTLNMTQYREPFVTEEYHSLHITCMCISVHGCIDMIMNLNATYLQCMSPIARHFFRGKSLTTSSILFRPLHCGVSDLQRINSNMPTGFNVLDIMQCS